MPTTITKSIGTTGRDYSTVQLWEDAIPADIVAVDELWKGEIYNDSGAALTGVVSFSAHTTDATRYIHLTAAAGESFMDDASIRSLALDVNEANYAVMKSTTGYTTLIQFAASVSYIIFDRIQLVHTHANSGWCLDFTGGAASTDCLIKNIVARTVNGSPWRTDAVTRMINVVWVTTASGGTGVRLKGGSTIIGCTLVRLTTNPPAGNAINVQSSGGSNIARSCAMFGFSTPMTLTLGTNYSGDLTRDNATDASSGLFGRNQRYNIPYSASSPFVDADNTGTDMRALPVTMLDTNGYYDAVNAPTDISGVTRRSNPTIGAWEITEFGGGGDHGGAQISAATQGNVRPRPFAPGVVR